VILGKVRAEIRTFTQRRFTVLMLPMMYKVSHFSSLGVIWPLGERTSPVRQAIGGGANACDCTHASRKWSLFRDRNVVSIPGRSTM
jgi:hypothetical protein